MAKCILADQKILGDYEAPYFVAEMNTSHYGKMENARLMIDKAVEAGCHCVKFQSWSADSLYSKTYYEENPFARRMITRFVFSEEQLKELSIYCREQKISFSSTPYCEREVDFLIEECGVPYIKIASMDLNNKPFLNYVSRTGIPIVLSTGMSETDEIRRAVDLILDNGNTSLCVLHCISVYPPEFKTIRLNNILGLRAEFPEIPIGFSDHSLGMEMAVAAVTLGSAMIEKHLTLDRSKIGMDNQMATEPEEMKNMIDCCNRVHLALGETRRIVSPAEAEQKSKMRRSLIALRNIRAGEVILPTDLGAKRPGTGLELSYGELVPGHTVNRDIEEDTVLYYEDINW